MKKDREIGRSGHRVNKKTSPYKVFYTRPNDQSPNDPSVHRIPDHQITR